ncbi:hypothetical protein TSOC_012141 [Tetrabaena socialis]|uniref:Uncharacterized protein n=1 Tax=Tetrabaena socialis TaxID=47790 RepID=A0A2J7ZNT2_9CHLO|nr:hypothetical protein TSOC_012141 [Tetrabaena socialis]|eukprot:PNH01925.1 hypothetical protein TSOC_012141 [Tetrabaena socialis]
MRFKEGHGKLSEGFDEAMAAERSLGDFQRRLTDVLPRLVSSCNSCLVKTVNFETLYGDALLKLLEEKERVDFMVRHQEAVAYFEDLAFDEMVTSALYKQAEDAGADPLPSRAATWELFAAMTRAEEGGNEKLKARFCTELNYRVKEAWDEAVKSTGLTLEEYELLRNLKIARTATYTAVGVAPLPPRGTLKRRCGPHCAMLRSRSTAMGLLAASAQQRLRLF